jgi:2,3-bisphosphoglycerate-dependent phosphoglycerate mutase
MMHLILVRHGQSQWNVENRFTGWVDVDLTPTGEAEAKAAGALLKEQGYTVDRCFVSPLKRARHTAELIRAAMGQAFPFSEAPEMIERFYGGLTGLNKTETAQKYGDEQVHIWRRSYDIAPPGIGEESELHPRHNPAYREFPFALPATESLKDVVDRVLPFRNTTLKAALQPGKTVMIVAHGNSNRALMKLELGLDEVEIQKLELPTGTPVVLDYDDAGRYQGYRMLTAQTVAA